MYRTRKILSSFIVLTLVLLFSISPVLAEETTGPIDEGTGIEETTAESIDESPSIEEEPTEVIEEEPETAEELAEVIEEAPVTEEEPAEIIEGPPVTEEEPAEIIEGPPVTEEEPTEVIEEVPGTAEEPSEVINEAPPAEQAPEYLGSDVLNVIVPITVSVTIDPLELAGRGQIYSNIYKIKNYGDNDVLLTFTDIQVTFADGANIKALARPVDQRIGSELKAIYMLLDFGRSDVPPAIITDPNQNKEISIPLSASQDEMTEDSLVQFDFSGSVNEASALSWRDNDVKICLYYTLETVPPPVEDILLPAEDELEMPITEEVLPETEEVTPETEEVTPETEEVIPETEEVIPETEPVDTAPDLDPPEQATPSETSPSELDSPEPPAPSEENQETLDHPAESSTEE